MTVFIVIVAAAAIRWRIGLKISRSKKQQLKKRRQPCMIVTGAMSDPYVHAEQRLRQTRQALEVIKKNVFGVALLTKSTRVLEDLDLLIEIGA